jgi:hypothetical protein
MIASGVIATLAANTSVGARSIGIGGQPGQVSDPTLTQVPARALSIGQAKAILAQMVRDKTITHVEDSPVGPAGTRVTLPSTLYGVSFQYLDHPLEIHDVDARFAVLLVRIAQFLAIHYGVMVVRHLGIYPGNPDHPNDVHNMGRAIDLAGFVGSSIGDIDVARDWGEMPAPWSPDATVTGYRLSPQDPGFLFFAALYDFLTKEAADRTSDYVANEGPSTVIGEHSYIVTPDHPTPALRAAHWNHVHAQIGPTRV